MFADDPPLQAPWTWETVLGSKDFPNLFVKPHPEGIEKIAEADANGYYDQLGPAPGLPEVRTQRMHLYVVDTSQLDLHASHLRSTPQHSRRHAHSDEYWFRAFAWLRRRFGRSPCVTFLPATSYTRLAETQLPLYGRGLPDFHLDNRGRNMARQQVKQQLDFVSGMRFAAARSPGAHMLIWEDDCFACPATLNAYSRAIATLSLVEPSWGCIKTGNGGSGLLFHSDLVSRLIAYLQTRRGSDNVDVSMWRFLQSGGWSDFISFRTRSAHRGLTSSFRLAQGAVWGRVKCGGELDFHWGFYSFCKGDSIRMKLEEKMRIEESSNLGLTDEEREARPPREKERADLVRALGVNASAVAGVFLREWQCSIHSPYNAIPKTPPGGGIVHPINIVLPPLPGAPGTAAAAAPPGGPVAAAPGMEPPGTRQPFQSPGQGPMAPGLVQLQGSINPPVPFQVYDPQAAAVGGGRP